MQDQSYFVRESPDFSIEFFERDDRHPFTVTAEVLENDMYPDFNGKVGDVLYKYEEE